MSRLRVVIVGVSGVAAAACLAGCDTTKNALGLGKVTPDEFRVVTKAPLVVPPDYALRPPAPGMPRPQELQPESVARQALLGERQAEQRSDGEKLFVARAGGDKADPLARYVIDDEFGAIAYKEKDFADTVMFWKKPEALAATPEQAKIRAANSPAPVDAAKEAARLKDLTGGKPIIIARDPEQKFKLPGL